MMTAKAIETFPINDISNKKTSTVFGSMFQYLQHRYDQVKTDEENEEI